MLTVQKGRYAAGMAKSVNFGLYDIPDEFMVTGHKIASIISKIFLED